MALNNKQRKFVSEYIKNPNATQAAKNAGYSEKTAYSQGQRLLKHDEIKAEIKRQAEKINKKNIADTEERMEILSEIMRNEDKYDSDRIRAIDTLNKMDATYITQIDMTTKQDVTVVNKPFEDLTADEIRAFINKADEDED